MAKFSGKNIEFKDGQQAVFGSSDDSAIFWDGNSNELMISTTVSGVDPTEDYHLTTKQYVTSSGVINHNYLNGLSADDHPQYVLADGSRAFTSTVAGVDPTEDEHLVTKSFLVSALLGTASGTEQVGNILFGSEFVYSLDNSESSTNSTTYQNKLTVTASGIPDGDYRLGWHFEWKISKNNVNFNYRVREDDTTNLSEVSTPTFNDVNIYNLVNNFYYLTDVASGTHHWDIEYCSNASSATSYIKSARLEFWRVS